MRIKHRIKRVLRKKDIHEEKELHIVKKRNGKMRLTKSHEEDSTHIHIQKKKSKKGRNVLKGMVVAFVFLFIIGALIHKPIDTLYIASEDILLDVYEEVELTFEKQPLDANATIDLKADDGIQVKIDKNIVKVKATNKEGGFTLYLTSNNVKSNVVKVNVVDSEKQAALENAKKEAEKKRIEKELAIKKAAEEKAQKEAEEKAAQEQRKIEEQEAEAARIAAEQAVREQAQSESQSQNVVSVPQENTSVMVYIASSGNGTKYHNNPNCSRMKGVVSLTRDDATARGYGACSKCY